MSGYVANLGALITLISDETPVIAGHGPLSSKKELQSSHDMILSTRSLVRNAMERGLSVEQIIEKGLGERWADWTWGFIPEERWIRTLHRDLSAR